MSWLQHPLAVALAWTLVHFLWQGSLAALAVALLLWLMKAASPKLQYAVACIGLLIMTALPVVTFLRLSEPPAVPSSIQETSNLQSPVRVLAGQPVAVPVAGYRQALERAMPYGLLVWFAGVLLLATRLAGGWAWLQWLRRRPQTMAAPDAQQLSLLRLCQRMGVGSNLRLLLCHSVPGPTLLGWLRPVILMPPALLVGLNPQQLELILAHELAHVLRHDYLINLLQSIAEVLFFFHPAVWWLSNKIRQERELASDDLAVRLCGDALDYAQALTTLETLASSLPSHAAPRLALGAQGGDFMSRIHRLVSPTAPTLLAPRAGLVVLLLLGGMFALQARTQSAAPPPKSDTSQPKGTVQMRRYDAENPGSNSKEGSIDLRALAVPIATIERALGTLQKTPANPQIGYVDLEVKIEPGEVGDHYTFRFNGVAPVQVLAIIRGQAARIPIEKKPGQLVIQRSNSFTEQGGLLPQGLYVDVWAGDVPADLVLQALNELEAMTPKAGIPQEVRRDIKLGMGKGPRIALDLDRVDPLEIRGILDAELTKKNP